MLTRTSNLARCLAMAALCAACSPVAVEGTPTVYPAWRNAVWPAPARDAGDELSDFLDRAGPGETALVTTADGGAAVRVAVEKDYHAASGRSCRRLVMVAAAAHPIPRTACRDEVGVWRLLPLLRNQGLSGLSLREAPGPDLVTGGAS